MNLLENAVAQGQWRIEYMIEKYHWWTWMWINAEIYSRYSTVEILINPFLSFLSSLYLPGTICFKIILMQRRALHACLAEPIDWRWMVRTWEIWNLLASNSKRITHRWCEPLTPLIRERGSVYLKCASGKRNH